MHCKVALEETVLRGEMGNDERPKVQGARLTLLTLRQEASADYILLGHLASFIKRSLFFFLIL